MRRRTSKERSKKGRQEAEKDKVGLKFGLEFGKEVSFKENNSRTSVLTALALLVGLRALRGKGQAVSEKNFKGAKRYQMRLRGWWMESSLSPLGPVDADRMLKCCNPAGRT